MMKKAICILGMLSLVACANASVQIWFDTASPWAGAGPVGGPLDPTGGRQLDYTEDGYQVANFPAGFSASTQVLVGNIAYIWLRFNSEPTNAKIQGLHLVATGLDPTQNFGDPNNPSNHNIAYYVANDMDGEGFKRWDGANTHPLDPEFKRLNQVLVAVTAYGIQNRTGNVAWNMYQGGTYRTVLLGAIKYTTLGTYKLSLGSLGISYTTPPNPTVEFGELVVIPEPASMLLLGLAGFLTRRR